MRSMACCRRGSLGRNRELFMAILRATSGLWIGLEIGTKANPSTEELVSPLVAKGINRFGERTILTIEYTSLIAVFLSYAFIEDRTVVAVLYIANLAGVNLSLGDQILLGITVVALSVGVAALPSASLVMMVIILNQLGLPIEYMALIVAVDRILDMCRTSLNVTSDLIVTKIVDEFEKRR